MNTAADHQHFSVAFFNRVWELLEKSDRTAEETERMISLCHASLAHWRLREDCAARNLSIGYWQLSRVYAVAGQAGNAGRYAELCLEVSGGEPAFYLAYAHESVARAAALAGDLTVLQKHAALARGLAAQVSDPEEVQMLQADLASLAGC